MPNVSQDLNVVYQAFQANGGDAAALASKFPMIQFQGNAVRCEYQRPRELQYLRR